MPLCPPGGSPLVAAACEANYYYLFHNIIHTEHLLGVHCVLSRWCKPSTMIIPALQMGTPRLRDAKEPGYKALCGSLLCDTTSPGMRLKMELRNDKREGEGKRSLEMVTC